MNGTRDRGAAAGPGALARLQQGLFLAWCLGLAVVLWQLAVQGVSAGRVGALLALVAGHALLLGLEFVLMREVNRRATGIAQPWGRVFGAWRDEVLFAVRVFFWRQPWASQSEPDLVPADGAALGRRGVVFVHGFVCNRGLWNPWMARLRAQGVPFVAVNLAPVFGHIDDYPPLIEAAVGRLLVATGEPPLIVAHSMGGLATRAWLRAGDNDARVHHVITLGTPHAGTWLALFAHSPNGLEMRWQGDWVRTLAAAEPPGRAALFTCWWSGCDQIVFPPPTAQLPGAAWRELPGVAHVKMVDQAVVFDDLVQRLPGA